MPRATDEQPRAKTPSKPRKPRTKKPGETTGDIRLTGDRLVVRVPENGERKSAGGLLIPATAMPAPKRLSWGEVALVGGEDVSVGDPSDQLVCGGEYG